MPQTEFRMNKTRLVLLFLGALAFVLIGIWFVFFPGALGYFPPFFIKLTGVISILFFGLCAWFIATRLFDSRPGLIISDEGITDYSSLVEAGFISWGDVQKIKNTEVSGQCFLTFFVTDPERVFRDKNFIQAYFMKLNQSLYESPIQISLANVKGKPEEIEKLIEEKWGRKIDKGDI